MRITRSGRVVRPCQRLVDAPDADDDVTDEDESEEMETSSSGDDAGSSLNSFIVDDSSSCTASSDEPAFMGFIRALFDGAPADRVDEAIDKILEEEIPREKYAGALAHLA